MSPTEEPFCHLTGHEWMGSACALLTSGGDPYSKATPTLKGERAKTTLHLSPPFVEVLSSTGKWIPGYELIRFEADGQVLIRSRRTGVSRHLSLNQWRDPYEIAALASLAMEDQP